MPIYLATIPVILTRSGEDDTWLLWGSLLSLSLRFSFALIKISKYLSRFSATERKGLQGWQWSSAILLRLYLGSADRGGMASSLRSWTIWIPEISRRTNQTVRSRSIPFRQNIPFSTPPNHVGDSCRTCANCLEWLSHVISIDLGWPNDSSWTYRICHLGVPVQAKNGVIYASTRRLLAALCS